MRHDCTIRNERAADRTHIAQLHGAAFGAESSVPALVQDLRELDAAFPTISLVATDGADVPLGHVMVSHAWLDGWDRMIDVMVLSPLGVRPDVQRAGIGTALIEAAMSQADGFGVPMVLLEGNPGYYGSRGFEAAIPLNIRRPSLRIPERAFQVRRLQAYRSSMTGTFVYHDIHWIHGVGLYR
ncbi:GNAT family N-acetyltransferase [Amaricoccus macauensis]|uniref:GNAT family N-acetyltransferase n=1 Tax=Amaricoccus macauensis TaxID=57001 RepID=UPI003C7C8FBD